MKKSFDRKQIIVIVFVIIILLLATTYALNSASIGVNLTTAIVGVDETAYGSTTFDSDNLDFVPILDDEVETKEDNVIKIDFKVGGASTNNNDNIIYDIALNDLEVSCNLLSPYIKWKLIKEGEEISSGSLDYKFDTIKDGRLVLTTIQEDLPDYNSNKTGYDDYTFYMWFSDSCQGSIEDCDEAVDQSSMLGKELNGKVEVELYTGNKKELVRNPGEDAIGSTCTGKYQVNLNANGGTVANESILVIGGSPYGILPTPEQRVDTVTFEPNGGTVVNGSSNEASTFSESVYYTFDGWYLDKNFETKITSEDIVTVSQDHELYAKWVPETTNIITLPTLEKTDSTTSIFLGWYKDSLLTSKAGNGGSNYTVDGDQTLYARWSDNKVYTVNFDNQGGTCNLQQTSIETIEDLTENEIQCTNSSSLTATFNHFNGLITTKTGTLTFDGLYTEPNGSGTKYYDATSGWQENITINSDITLYANYTGSSIELPEEYERVGYDFLGWYTEDGVLIEGDEENNYVLEENLVLESHWEANEYEVMIDQQNATTPSDPTTVDVTFESDLPSLTSTPKREYTVTLNYYGNSQVINLSCGFEGMFQYANGQGTKYYDKNGNSVTVWDIPGASTIYVDWSDPSITLPSIELENDGKYYDIWYYDENGTTKVEDNVIDYCPTSDIELYAIEIDAPVTYTIDYNLNNGTHGESHPTSGTYNTAVQISNPTPPSSGFTLNFNENNSGATISTTSVTKSFTFDGWTAQNLDTSTAKYGDTSTNITTSWNGETKTTATWFINLSTTDDTTVTMTANWSASVQRTEFPTIVRLGYNCYWGDSNGNKVNSYQSSNNETTATLYAWCNPATYSITLVQDDATERGTEIVFGTYDAYLDDITIPKREYTVTLNANGGSVSSSSTKVTYPFNGYFYDDKDDDKSNDIQYYDKDGKGIKAWDIANTSSLYADWETCTWNTLPDATRQGYTFGGWYTAATGGTKVTTASCLTSDTTLYAHWTPITYSITYALNNGSYGESHPTSGTYDTVLQISNPTKDFTIYFEDGNCSITPSQTSKSGSFTFNGWSGSQIDTATAMYGTSDSSVTTLWTIGSNKVTSEYFKNLRSTTGTVTMTANWTGNAITLPSITKAGYNNYWNTEKDGSGTNYAATGSGTYTPAGTDATSKTLFAYCSAKTTTITLDKQGGTGGTDTVVATYGQAMPTATAPTKSFTVTFNTGVTGITVSSETINYEFGGYYTSTGGSGTQYYTSAMASARTWNYTSTTKTLYAKWTSKSITLPSSLTGADETCYSGIDEWYSDSSLTTSVGKPGESYTPTDNVTLYAKLTRKTTEITFNKQGGTGGTDTVKATCGLDMPTATAPTKTFTVSYNTGVSGLTVSASTASQTFGGYYTSTGGSGTQYYTSTMASARTWSDYSNNETTLYAKWTNKAITLSAAPTRSGYTFAGWYSDSSLTTLVGMGGATYTPTASITLYAKWTDATAPIISAKSHEDTSDTTANITITATDSGGSGLSTCKAVSGSTTYSGTFSGSTCTITGVTTGKTYTLTATDGAGNTSASVTEQATLHNYNVGDSYWVDELDTAVSKAANGDTIKVLQNVTDSGTLKKGITLDLNSKTLTASATIYISNGSIATITGTNVDGATEGQIVSSLSSNTIQSQGSLTIESGTFSSTGNSSNSMFAHVATSQTTIINGGTFTSTGYTVGIASATSISIHKATITSSSADTSNGVGSLFASDGGTITMESDVTVTNTSGFAIVVGGSSTNIDANGTKIYGSALVGESGKFVLYGGGTLTRKVSTMAGITVYESGILGIDKLASTSSTSATTISGNSTTNPLISVSTSGIVYHNGGLVSNSTGVAVNNSDGSYYKYPLARITGSTSGTITDATG